VYSVLSATPNWLDSHQYLALWIEGIALLLIFAWDRWDSHQQHKQTLAQMEIMQSQARATETAANAANKSAEPLINSERAWIIAELVPICVEFGGLWSRPVGSIWATLSDEEILNGVHMRHKLKLTNMGRTPAHILRYRVSYSCLGKGVTSLPRGRVTSLSRGTVEIQDSVLTFDHLLGATDSIEVPEVVDVNEYMKNRIKGIKELENTAVFHGWVEYQHVFSDSEVVKVSFCYSYKPSTLGLVRVPETKGIEYESIGYANENQSPN
jgi:hypothetical protein